ncbi:ubiquitin-like domain-containing protein [Haematococcus lacustris]|uniref:Ubiquitin-like domain-containing protein n=1 Tax=Haematococcus lacustris TaxID=44745 RepID=A0A699YJX4_HAELA|nr:ubiquitin-like domain-containing protein [Haematococcus lacustris]
MAEGSTLHIKFRTTNGDVGPLSFSDSQTVQQAKEKLWAEWPKEGPLSKEAPSSPNDIRLILGGKYVDAGKTLKEYRKDMGDIGLDSVVFFHMIVRPVPNPAKAGGAPSPKEEVQKQSCASVVATGSRSLLVCTADWQCSTPVPGSMGSPSAVAA